MAACELIILDCDGVLIDSEIISLQMLVDALAELGVALDLAYVGRHFLGRSYPTVMAEIRHSFGIALPPDFEEQYRERLLQAFRTDLRIMPGVQQMLQDLDRPYCVATSSSPRRVEMSLRLVGLWQQMGPVTFTASEVAHGKPAPDLFLHAAARMGVAPDRCLVIEDSLPGIRAGLAAGMQVWRFTGGSHMAHAGIGEPPDARPHHRFDDFNSFFASDPGLRIQR